MKIQFDAHQEHQAEALQAVLDLLDGQPGPSSLPPTLVPGGDTQMDFIGTAGFANPALVADSALLGNLRKVQEQNGIRPLSEELSSRNFSIEMETGTGKTYVYLRTIFELKKRFGFTKFIIVVPSIAIREGVLNNIELTREHFGAVFDHEPFDAWVYGARRVSWLRQFATTNQLQVLILNIDAFNKSTNVIHNELDQMSGHKPIEFIRSTRPVVILDEPQNLEGTRAKEAIETLQPLFTLRYSATHRELHNLLYRLDPVRAYDKKLVKRIEVDSIVEQADFNQPYIRIKSITAAKSKVTAKLEVDVQGKLGPERKVLSLTTAGVDLANLTQRDNYRGYTLEEIDADRGFVAFSNGVRLSVGHTHGGRTDEIQKAQVRETVKEHLDKEMALRSKLPAGDRMKVLSLFFIDRVANYVPEDGKIRRFFVEAYQDLSRLQRYSALALPQVEEVHGGYFAQAKGEAKDTREGRVSSDDEEAYELIMKDKERLLSLETPLRFIFSHSALREGWDNPNVFQICTLNDARSEIRKRQEIGRGMRLPVLESGMRCFDPQINRLTVIANESYADFARSLQREIAEECGVEFEDGLVKNKRERRTLKLKKGWNLNQDFLQLWERIKHKTRYGVNFSTRELIVAAAQHLKGLPRVDAAKLLAVRAKLDLSDEGVESTVLASRETGVAPMATLLPDMVGYLQQETELTRATLGEIIIESGRLDEVQTNPQGFIDLTLRAVRRALDDLIVRGIKYEKVADQSYELKLFEDDDAREVEAYLSRMLKVDHSIYEEIEFDSGVERAFAEAIDKRDDIKLFLKLPRWFEVETPVGKYRPDWAIVKQPEGEAPKLYLVCETKGTLDPEKLRGAEQMKLKCGERHFEALKVPFKVVTTAREM